MKNHILSYKKYINDFINNINIKYIKQKSYNLIVLDISFALILSVIIIKEDKIAAE